MSTNEPKSFCIHESQHAAMVFSDDATESSVRLARFLKPCARSVAHVATFPTTRHEKKHPNLKKFYFKGWKNPQRKWGDWIEWLTGQHGFTWNQAGICDALLSSMYEVRCNKNLIFGLVEYWCPQTNTFVFPWGEATITLEDVMILGGFSVLGEPATIPLSDELLAMEEKMVELRRKMCRSKSKKVDQQSWMKFFMEESESHELEHVGFLSLWLSRFVFPSLRESNIETHVFPIAIHLSQGSRLALAPAVLASLYHSLSLLKEQVISSDEDSVTVFGPFQLVQLWANERFPILGPRYPKELKLGEPRAARWHKLNSDATSASLILSTLECSDNFQWRPFASDLKNWCFVSHYKDNEQVVVDGSNSAEELKSFGICLCSNELVGLQCIKKYMPYRVAMQFGMDQHLPGDFIIMQPFYGENFSFYVPARSYKPSVSLMYFNWWQKSKLIRRKETLKPETERKIDDSNFFYPIQRAYTASDKIDMLSVLESNTENSLKRKLSTKEENKEMESDRCVVSKNLVVQEDKIKRRALEDDPSYYSDLNIVIGVHSKGLPSEERKQHGVGSSNNPLDIEDYACTTLGTESNPIDIDN